MPNRNSNSSGNNHKVQLLVNCNRFVCVVHSKWKMTENTLYLHFVQSLAEVEMQNLNTELMIVEEDVVP